MSNSPQRASAEKPTKKKKATRKKRSRPTPRLLTQDNDLDELAKRRTLMILSVLSGQVTVTDAIESAKISRPRYYQLEIQAIQGMMRELGSDGGLDTQYRQAQRTIEELQGQLQKLQTDKQRLEHLLTVTRKVVKSGPMTLSKRRPKKARAARTGSSVSTSSQEEVTSTEASSSPTSTAER